MVLDSIRTALEDLLSANFAQPEYFIIWENRGEQAPSNRMYLAPRIEYLNKTPYSLGWLNNPGVYYNQAIRFEVKIVIPEKKGVRLGLNTAELIENTYVNQGTILIDSNVCAHLISPPQTLNIGADNLGSHILITEIPYRVSVRKPAQ